MSDYDDGPDKLPGDEFEGDYEDYREGGGESAEVAAAPTARGFYVTPRQTFAGLAIALAVILVLLLGYLWWLSRPADFTEKGGEKKPGVEPILSIYGPGRGDKPRFDSPMGVAWGAEDRIYVADSANSRVNVFGKEGDFLFQFGGFGIAKPLEGAVATWKPGLLDYPTDVAVDHRNGDVYVADFYNDSISVFTEKGKFIRRFPDPQKPVGRGSSGAEGKGIAVTAVAVADGKVYATDTYQVFVFTTNGALLRQFGMPGLDPGQLDHPNGIAVDSRGRVYVSDSNHNRVQAFDSKGTHLWTTGTKVSDLQKETDNPFVLPRGLAVDADGSILVADPLGQSIVRLSENGAVLATYGSRGSAAGEFNFPNDLDVRDGLVLVADKENDRVQLVKLTNR